MVRGEVILHSSRTTESKKKNAVACEMQSHIRPCNTCSSMDKHCVIKKKIGMISMKSRIVRCAISGTRSLGS